MAPVPAPDGTITTILSSAHETYSKRADLTPVSPPLSELANSTYLLVEAGPGPKPEPLIVIWLPVPAEVSFGEKLVITCPYAAVKSVHINSKTVKTDRLIFDFFTCALLFYLKISLFHHFII